MIPIAVQESTMLPNGCSLQIGKLPVSGAIMGERIICNSVEFAHKLKRQLRRLIA